MKKVLCKECGADIGVPEDAIKGEIVTCPDCGTDYEVVKMDENKVSIKLAESIGEDWGE
jgi:alpha-aminoadipate carrier protein LysW